MPQKWLHCVAPDGADAPPLGQALVVLEIPSILRDATNDKNLVGDYLLSCQDDWFQPYSQGEINFDEMGLNFDGVSITKQGLLVGAIRICNTGCEGYHIYAFTGEYKGTVWSDQRVPFGKITKICTSIEKYIANVRNLGEKHIALYEKDN